MTISACGQCDPKDLQIRRQVDIEEYRSMESKTTTTCRMVYVELAPEVPDVWMTSAAKSL